MNKKFNFYVHHFIFFTFLCLVVPCQAQWFKTDSLLKVLSPKQDTVRAWQLLHIANNYLRTDSNQVKHYTNQALALAQKLHYGRGEIRAYAIYGELYYYNANFDRADYWYDLIIERGKNLKRVEDYKLAVLNSKALTAYRRGNYLKTIQYTDISVREAEKALKIKENKRYNFERILYMGLNMQGNVYATNAFNGDFVNKQEYDKAYQCFRRCLNLCQQYQTIQHNLPTVCHNIACYYKDTRKSIDSALYYFDEEIRTATALGREVDLIGAYYQKAEILFDKNQLAKAAYLLEKAQLLTNKYPDPDHIIIIPHLLGRIYTKTGQYSQATSILNKALTLVEEKKMVEQIRAIRGSMYENYKKQGDYKNALLQLEQVAILKDSLYNENTTKTINELSIKYETEKKEQQIKALETEKTLRNYLITALIALATGSGFAVWSKYKAIILEKTLMQQTALLKQEQTEKLQIEAEKLQIEMDSKQRALAMQGLYLEQRKNILQEVKTKLTTINNNDALDKKAIIKEIDNTLHIEYEWQKARVHVENIDPEFFQKILLQHNNLTDLELRHLAYIKLGLSPKQVAQLLNIETESASMARVRLKKKLNLSTEINLKDFVQGV